MDRVRKMLRAILELPPNTQTDEAWRMLAAVPAPDVLPPLPERVPPESAVIAAPSATLEDRSAPPPPAKSPAMGGIIAASLFLLLLVVLLILLGLRRGGPVSPGR